MFGLFSRQLVIVAGVSASGKSSLIRRLTKDRPLRQRLGVPHRAKVIEASKSNPIHPPRTAILHYDTLRPWFLDLPGYDADAPLALIDMADRVSAITVTNTPEVLRQRMEERFPRERARNVHARYGEPGFIERKQGEWADWLGRKSIATRWILSDESYTDLPNTSSTVNPTAFSP